MSTGLLQVFVELGSLHETSNHVLYLNPRGSLVLIPLTITRLICRLQVQSWPLASNNTGVLSTHTRLWSLDDVYFKYFLRFLSSLFVWRCLFLIIFFLSSLLAWSCLFLIFLGTCSFLFIQVLFPITIIIIIIIPVFHTSISLWSFTGVWRTASLFRLPGYVWCLKIYGYIAYLKIYGTHVTANNSTNNNVGFFFVSDLKIVFYKNY